MTTATRATSLRQVAFTAMGCRMLAAVDGPEVIPLSTVPAWFAAWEDCLSRFLPASELTRLNAAGGRPLPVSETLWRVLHTALWAARRSDGLVVPTVLPALEAAGYDRPFANIDAGPRTTVAMPPAASTDSGDWRTIRCSARTRTVQLAPGMRLDLGGVAKGWAADRAARRLGATWPALVDAGGDIAVSAPPHDARGWAVGVADPFTPGGQLALLALAGGGVATSGTDYRRWQRDDRWHHHLIDPRTGRSANTDLLSATIVAPSAREAEVAAKIVILLGHQAGLAWLATRPSLAGLLVSPHGDVATSARWSRYVWS